MPNGTLFSPFRKPQAHRSPGASLITACVGPHPPRAETPTSPIKAKVLSAVHAAEHEIANIAKKVAHAITEPPHDCVGPPPQKDPPAHPHQPTNHAPDHSGEPLPQRIVHTIADGLKELKREIVEEPKDSQLR